MSKYWKRLKTWFMDVTREGAHSTAMACFIRVWDVIEEMPAGDTGYLPARPGKHRPERIAEDRKGMFHRLSAEAVLKLVFPPTRMDWATWQVKVSAI